MNRPLFQREYVDYTGEERRVPESTAGALDAFFSCRDGVDEPAVIVVRCDGGALSIALPEPWLRLDPDRWLVTHEDGTAQSGTLATAAIELRGLAHGYYRVAVLRGDLKLSEAPLIVAPKRAYLPAPLEAGQRIWGVSAQLYALRSERNWGIGDFTDLAELIARAAAAGASLVGVNPLHALSLSKPQRASPYSPISREFLNVLYLDPEAIADFVECEPARRLRQSPEFTESLEGLRRATLVDYEGVAAQKLPILQLLYRSFRELHLGMTGDSRERAFRVFQHERGAPLREFATFQALQAYFTENAARPDCQQWPDAFQDAQSKAVSDFAHENESQIEFYEYLQWQATLQLEHCILRAETAQMPIGLYLDVAVGVNRNSASVWAHPENWGRHWSIGAPPDLWNSLGQNWDLPPPDPLAMRQTGYADFRSMLAANMVGAGAIRLDHILALMRLFWIPEGSQPRDGAYVSYPLHDLLSIVALESHRHRCLVIGEDLGTVPAGLDAALREFGILSYRLLYFEKDVDGSFKRPEAWEKWALGAITTHDLPTFAGYWEGTDIAWKAALRLIPNDGHERMRVESDRAHERASMANAIGADESTAVPALAAHSFVAKTASLIVMVQLEDLLGIEDQANMPGTIDEHPNWRRKLPLDLPALFEKQGAIDTFDVLRKARPPLTLGAPATSIDSDTPLRTPTATYRLQFNASFTFRDAAAIIPYLHDLGISHVYASSYLKARPGSTHGYDITDHNALNPEIGTPAEFDLFCDVLHQHGMGQILDFIPNHMGIGKADNSLWLDVLEWGENSFFSGFFDINWRPRQESLRGRILVPVLGGQYGDVLERGDIVLRFDAATGHLNFWYHEHCFPLRPRDYPRVLNMVLATEPFTQLAGSALLSPEPTRDVSNALKEALARLCQQDSRALAAMESAVARYTGVPGNPSSFVPLHELLERQVYRLAYWRVAADEINFRRFFDINDLAGLSMERAEVFEHTHQFVGRMISEGRLHGLRLDHLDGLYDPQAYLDRLQKFAARCQRRPYHSGDDLYVVAEKILAPHEPLPENWPIAGTTGYSFINLLARLQTDPKGERVLDRCFRRIAGRPVSFEPILHACKLLVMETILPSELNTLATDLDHISEQHWGTRDYTLERLRAALREVAAGFPVYRTYIAPKAITAEDRRYIDWAVAQARKTYDGPDPEILDFVEAALTADLARDNSVYNAEDVFRFAMKFQQYTSPVTAKALEDTAFYRYARLLSLNEVGGDPTRFSLSPQAFHRAMQNRAKRWPHALSASATHDTKRGEDMRARLSVLSELAHEWEMKQIRWFSLNRIRRHESEDLVAPSAVDAYIIYQTLLGAWPPAWAPHETISSEAMDQFRVRVRGTILKSIREAKSQTSWTNPNTHYENATLDFVDKILDLSKPNPFLEDFRAFAAHIAPFGALNGLSQSVLKLTAPGVPDIYQGCELWDHSMVDPDNRRPVDFETRAQRLAQITALRQRKRGGLADAYRHMLRHWQDGQIKLAILAPLLALRRDERTLFLQGNHEVIDLTGRMADHALAFVRRHEDKLCLVVVGLRYAGLCAGYGPEIYPGGRAWLDTRLSLKGPTLTNVFTRREAEPDLDGFLLGDLLAELPVGVFLGKT